MKVNNQKPRNEDLTPFVYTKSVYNNLNNKCTILQRLRYSDYNLEHDDQKYIDFALNFPNHSKITIIFKTRHQKNSVIGISISTFGMGVLRNIWHKTVPHSKTVELEKKFLNA